MQPFGVRGSDTMRQSLQRRWASIDSPFLNPNGGQGYKNLRNYVFEALSLPESLREIHIEVLVF